ncbi:tRNA lysidine(34) synthetase TilS, partial [Listeria monocytogenes]|uniref:tRNA lysidine(34) synthetase TilS n=1 Tax=Listeria monocytogenes TaxID=1639 RepID=UPI003204C198
ENAAKEQRVVETFCERQGIPFYIEEVDIKSRAQSLQKGLEETARIVRYDFFEKVMAEKNINKLVLAHHADDQIETILMRLVRGSASIGWSGIQPKGYIYIGFDSEYNESTQIWGFHHDFNWKLSKLTPPKFIQGKIILNEDDINPGESKRIGAANSWETIYDESSGWLRFGGVNNSVETCYVEFFPNTIM